MFSLRMSKNYKFTIFFHGYSHCDNGSTFIFILNRARPKYVWSVFFEKIRFQCLFHVVFHLEIRYLKINENLVLLSTRMLFN